MKCGIEQELNRHLDAESDREMAQEVSDGQRDEFVNSGMKNITGYELGESIFESQSDDLEKAFNSGDNWLVGIEIRKLVKAYLEGVFNRNE